MTSTMSHYWSRNYSMTCPKTLTYNWFPYEAVCFFLKVQLHKFLFFFFFLNYSINDRTGFTQITRVPKSYMLEFIWRKKQKQNTPRLPIASWEAGSKQRQCPVEAGEKKNQIKKCNINAKVNTEACVLSFQSWLQKPDIHACFTLRHSFI